MIGGVPTWETIGFSSFGSYIMALVALVLVHHVVVYGIARLRGQPGVAIMALRDVVIGTLWLLSILGSWMAIYFYLRALYRAFFYEDVAAGLGH
ncbi:hypothetical protein AU374_05894 [Cupriavidus metallidurans]|jgi:hypothetical protein|nr:hypothetical protein C3Z06_32310 [Cupriavidus metallidurans]KWW32294.1 hypothetical protein AU374_05894 [Cupriavidus metallidurans]